MKNTFLSYYYCYWILFMVAASIFSVKKSVLLIK